MSNDDQESTNDAERTISKKSKPWFRTTRAGVLAKQPDRGLVGAHRRVGQIPNTSSVWEEVVRIA